MPLLPTIPLLLLNKLQQVQQNRLQQVAYGLKFAILLICHIVAHLILAVKLNVTCYSSCNFQIAIHNQAKDYNKRDLHVACIQHLQDLHTHPSPPPAAAAITPLAQDLHKASSSLQHHPRH